MTTRINVGGANKNVVDAYINVAETNRRVIYGMVNVGGMNRYVEVYPIGTPTIGVMSTAGPLSATINWTNASAIVSTEIEYEQDGSHFTFIQKNPGATSHTDGFFDSGSSLRARCRHYFHTNYPGAWSDWSNSVIVP